MKFDTEENSCFCLLEKDDYERPNILSMRGKIQKVFGAISWKFSVRVPVGWG